MKIYGRNNVCYVNVIAVEIAYTSLCIPGTYVHGITTILEMLTPPPPGKSIRRWRWNNPLGERSPDSYVWTEGANARGRSKHSDASELLCFEKRTCNAASRPRGVVRLIHATSDCAFDVSRVELSAETLNPCLLPLARAGGWKPLFFPANTHNLIPTGVSRLDTYPLREWIYGKSEKKKPNESCWEIDILRTIDNRRVNLEMIIFQKKKKRKCFRREKKTVFFFKTDSYRIKNK